MADDRGATASQAVTRRDFLRIATVATAAGLAAACAPAVTEPRGSAPATAPTAAGGTPKAGVPKRGGILVAAAETNPTGLDPHKATSLASQSVVEQVYDTLFELTPDLKVVPRLAKSMETPDEKTYVIHLQEGVKFSDGSDLTSEDVKFSFERIKNPATGSGRAVWFQQIDGIETPDKNTVRVTMKQPYAPFASALANGYNQIVSKKFTEAQGGDLSKVTMGSGPYVLAEYVPDQRLRLERNPNYWRKDRPYLDGVTWKIIPDDQARVAALRSKDVDNAWFLDAKSADLFKGNPDYAYYEVPVLTHAVTHINTSKPPFDNPNVRRAMALALDRKEFLDTVAFGRGQITGSIPAPEKEWAVPVQELPTYKRDIAKAKQLLAEAGHPNGFSATLRISAQYVLDVGNAQVLQAQMKPLGIDIKIEQLEWGNLLTAWTKSDFQMLNLLMLGQPDPDGYTWGRYHSKSPANYLKLSDPELDALLDKGRTAVNLEERKKIYRQAQVKIDELSPILFYYVYNVWGIFRPYVKGVTPMPNSSAPYLRDLWLDK